ncbi:MAG TPA: GSCFA domain-containing protein [Chitinophagaceae bacterium]|nr:GSCFA domain-containing protein [Chitinophagaceae bacterium]
MEFMVPIDIKKPARQITYGNRLLLVGSCFTEHIGQTLSDLKFSVLQNPHGILFDPASVTGSLLACVENRAYSPDDLFQLNELWHSWDHHSRFSGTDPASCLHAINASLQQAHAFLKQADWLIITLGSAFSYRLTGEAARAAVPNSRIMVPGRPVANCHRAPAQWFQKHLMAIEEIQAALDTCYHRLIRFNPNLQILFTVSPVRHIRDGVVENNRSKARLLEAVHHLTAKFPNLYYFPAYELVIDVLRDYRFYDADLVHPNYMATEFVMERFSEACVTEESRQLMQEVRRLTIARKHKPFHPHTVAHRQFLQSHLEKARILAARYPFLDLREELAYFGGAQ